MNKALLLDRDGVINKEINYLYKIADVEFIDGIFEACNFFQKKGYLIIVTTNQAGIARGIFTEDDFNKLNNWMLTEFQCRGVEIAKTYYCPYHPTEGIGQYRKDSYDRKPNPGMIFKAREDFDLNLRDSILVGDKESDVAAGINAGVGTNVLVKSGHAIGSVTKANLIIDSVKDLPRALKLA
jgi:D-glycero-D-manno-heptose 1,7-bisphosphate phosphatase